MDYIKIKGYKSIKDIDLLLTPINILIGANGAGKSNFMSFFEFLNRLYNKGLTEYTAINGGIDKFLHKGIQTTQEIEGELGFDNGVNGYSFKIASGDNRFVVVEEYLMYNGGYGWNISNYGNEANVKTSDNFRAKYVRKYLTTYKKYHFHDTGKNSPFNAVSNILNDSFFLYERGSNLASFLYAIKNDHFIVYNRIIRAVQSIAPYFSDFYFQPNSEGHIRLLWQDKYSNVVYSAADLSDGTIRFIALVALFMQPNLPASIIIDEPELGLHPFAVAKLAGMVQSVAAKGVQVILATQSSDLINHFDPENIITVDQIKGESVFNRLNKESLSNWIEEYKVGELWQRNIIEGGQP